MATREVQMLIVATLIAGCADDAVGDEDPLSSSESTAASSESSGPEDTETSAETSAGSETGPAPEIPALLELWVEVTLDGEPIEGATVAQGGAPGLFPTDSEGRALVPVDTTLPGDLGLIASHTSARSRVAIVDPANPGSILLELERFELGDNEAYAFNPPGVPEARGSTAECGHCHAQLKEQWYDSPHRRSASNPAVHDIYAGAAASFATPEACASAGGQWWQGLEPGTGEAAPRCYLGAGALPDLNEGCGELDACDALATEFGACADCHAPAIDGELGGRDLLEAVGTSYDSGVHCDLCHKVDSVELEAPAGVAGRLVVTRPLELPTSPGTGLWKPLSFGPYADVPNPRMGATPRTLFLEAEFCAGCHQLDQQALVPGTSLDPGRWPADTFPAHSTYEEWREGPFFEVAPCSSCHMPADPQALNGADLLAEDVPLQGIARGWVRPPGAVRQHTWVGPRTPSSAMLQLAAAVFVDTALVDQEFTATIRVRNVGAGHAIPTGEPLRSLVLFVQARCGDEILVATGGDAIPGFGGWLDRKPSPEDWTNWPGAAVGDVIRVVEDAGWHDYEGFGPFGDGSFDAAQKGLPQLRVLGQASVIAVNGDQVTLDQPLPPGDLAYRGRPDPFTAGAPTAAAAVAGAPGFAFARVLADQDGAHMVPHHRAVDVVADNRLLPQHEWTSAHVFEATCAEPIVDALLVHRAYPVELAAERGWASVQQVMVEVSK